MSDTQVFASQGIEPWLANADAGTRRPQLAWASDILFARAAQSQLTSVKEQESSYAEKVR